MPDEPTDRELQVLEAVTRPRATRYSAARELGITPSTVRVHLHNLYRKLGVRTSGQAWRVLNGRQAA